mmetsp:Transcript_13803/g.38850  ORF Transcript_13803/g.38850 Transcript_13803/m.38850 type:complete len:209 (-) Transcript_13803:293-919(-)
MSCILRCFSRSTKTPESVISSGKGSLEHISRAATASGTAVDHGLALDGTATLGSTPTCGSTSATSSGFRTGSILIQTIAVGDVPDTGSITNATWMARASSSFSLHLFHLDVPRCFLISSAISLTIALTTASSGTQTLCSWELYSIFQTLYLFHSSSFSDSKDPLQKEASHNDPSHYAQHRTSVPFYLFSAAQRLVFFLPNSTHSIVVS